MGCFDLETFVGLNERSRKASVLLYFQVVCVICSDRRNGWVKDCFILQWQCPICLKNYSLEDVLIDPFFNRIVNMVFTQSDFSFVDYWEFVVQFICIYFPLWFSFQKLDAKLWRGDK